LNLKANLFPNTRLSASGISIGSKTPSYVIKYMKPLIWHYNIICAKGILTHDGRYNMFYLINNYLLNVSCSLIYQSITFTIPECKNGIFKRLSYSNLYTKPMAQLDELRAIHKNNKIDSMKIVIYKSDKLNLLWYCTCTFITTTNTNKRQSLFINLFVTFETGFINPTIGYQQIRYSSHNHTHTLLQQS